MAWRRHHLYKPFIAPAAAAAGPVTGAAAITEADDTLSAAGTVLVVGAASITEDADTLSAAGVVTIVGAASITEDDDTLSATGTALGSVTGSAIILEADDTLDAEIHFAVIGTEDSATQVSGGWPGRVPVRTRMTEFFDAWREEEDLLVLFDMDMETVKMMTGGKTIF